MVKKIKKILHKLAKSTGIKRHPHEHHSFTLRRLILSACLFSLVIVSISSWLFYKDPRSKYDLVRPGRRELPNSFKAEEDSSIKFESKDDIKVEIQHIQSQLKSLDTYGNFTNDALSNDKVLQNYLDQPVLEQ
ncbi:MAG: hypothetical protein H6799_02475 [Candidatus Nomurabacteria bacterium]|nr:MAG: hypothetical protein H6799_02475 [Candidatus Nomurabacteria bacterium]HRV75842.1 hypothetical protein [Candidatus Saccharimonadales bacterium]